ncbi:toxin-antitoxin system HicB family antitoxin [Tessaracoccus caeni]|uniref:toxin-antitoxin system HicB family antitoxin n=1 Tax=Tessaracoccus caeni TaxID=3031239 RepID=UPI0023DBA75B|nr:toxin-antitoxin system HicB family antitoxin [Tessaracoccus caeni]MDF1488225.1 toxin-antitoxin system HicB family antitoxin [Tessaracoccus caeni]
MTEHDGGAAFTERPRQPKPSRKQLLLRLDPAVHEALSKWAADDLRSLNAHIEKLLRDALRTSGRDVQAGPMRRPGRPRRDSE